MSLGLPLNHCRGTLPLSASLRRACSFVTSTMYCLLNFLGRASVPRIRPGKDDMATASCKYAQAREVHQSERDVDRQSEHGTTRQQQAACGGDADSATAQCAQVTYVGAYEIYFEKLFRRVGDRRRALERPAEEFRSHEMMSSEFGSSGGDGALSSV